MKATTASCENCGADLPASLGTVQCKYCGKETLLRATNVKGALPAAERSDSSGRIILSSAAGLLFVIIVVVVMTISSDENTDMAPSPASPAGTIQAAQEAIAQAAELAPPADTRPTLQSQLCLLDDLNDDGVQEVAGLLSAEYNAPKLPTILDGATGDIHWQGDAIADSNQLYQLCLGGSWIGVVDNDAFSLVLINVHTPSQQVRHALSDQLDRYGAGDSCFSFRTNDHRNVGFSATDGSQTTCAVRPRSRPHIEDSTTCGIISTHRQGASFEAEGITYRVRGRRPGTAFLEVRATRGRRELWDESLRLLPVGGGAIGCFIAAAAPGVLVVFGSPRGDGPDLIALGLNAESGTERYATEFADTGERVRGIYYNGRYVVLGLGNRVVALNPTSGDLAW